MSRDDYDHAIPQRDIESINKAIEEFKERQKDKANAERERDT